MSNLTDPRVLFAAERTMLAWNRTSISLMAFGFVVERFGLFMKMIGRSGLIVIHQREISFYLGVVFLLLSCLVSLFSVFQYRQVVAGLKPDEIPPGYRLWGAGWVNGTVGVLALFMLLYLIYGFQA